MYLNFYGLRCEPFHITPDPEFLYLSPSHREALAVLYYGVARRKGFIAVTGEVGTGKTTVVRSYLAQRDPGKLRPLYLFNAKMGIGDVIGLCLHGLGAHAGGDSLASKLNRLHWALIEAYRRGETVVLFVDEAQSMPVDTLEGLRQLSNLETHTEKLIQVVLVGQPELEGVLAQHALRQLEQRIAIRTRLRPLSHAESLDYMRHRLDKAAALGAPAFAPAALRAAARRCGGIPRRINILCENALIEGYARQEKPIGAATVRRAARAMRPARALRGWRFHGEVTS